MLLFQGTRDPLVPHTQAYAMAEAMTSYSIPGRVELLIGAGHGWGDPELKRTVESDLRLLRPAPQAEAGRRSVPRPAGARGRFPRR